MENWVKTQDLRDALWREWKSMGATQFSQRANISARRAYAIFREGGPETIFTHDRVVDRILTGLGRSDLYYQFPRFDRYPLSTRSRRTTQHNEAQRRYYQKNKERINARHREYWHKVVKPKRQRIAASSR
jgi:hypothetical protein